MTPPDLTELAERCEKLTEPCRETDLAIHLALYPDGKIAQLAANHRRGFDSETGTAWEILNSAVCYETRNEQGHCYSNGGYPLPAVTGSLDAGMTLVPEGFAWMVGCAPGEGFFATLSTTDEAIEAGKPDIDVDNVIAATPALALTAASLRARDGRQFNISIASDEEIQRHYGDTDGFTAADLIAVVSKAIPHGR